MELTAAYCAISLSMRVFMKVFLNVLNCNAEEYVSCLKANVSSNNTNLISVTFKSDNNTFTSVNNKFNCHLDLIGNYMVLTE